MRRHRGEWQACSLIVGDTVDCDWRQGGLWLVTVGQDWRENGTMVGVEAGKSLGEPGLELSLVPPGVALPSCLAAD